MKKSQTILALDKALGNDVVDKRLEILRSLATAGSISEAARSNGVSYKAAWQAIETLSNLAGTVLIDTSVGGQGGGGARLTPAGALLLTAADLLSQAKRDALNKMGQGQPSGLNVLGVSGINLRTSMRNHLPCTITAIKKTPGIARVTMRLIGSSPMSASITARITAESFQLLGLSEGMRVLALCKATGVAIVPSAKDQNDMNRLTGQVTRRSRTKGAGEVSLQIAPGLQLIGFSETASQLELQKPAVALVDETAVVIGLLG